MTTNAMSLARSAQRLADAGLQRVNISCDSLDPIRFATIRRVGTWPLFWPPWTQPSRPV